MAAVNQSSLPNKCFQGHLIDRRAKKNKPDVVRQNAPVIVTRAPWSSLFTTRLGTKSFREGNIGSVGRVAIAAVSWEMGEEDRIQTQVLSF